MIHRLYNRLIAPRSKDEDGKRREYILNIFLLGGIFIAFAAFIEAQVDLAFHLRKSYIGVSPELLLIPLVFLLILYTLSRLRFNILSAYIFLSVLFMLGTYPMVKWIYWLPQSLLIYTLLIVMAGVLISTRLAFIVTIIEVALQIGGSLAADLSWTTKGETLSDAIVVSATFAIIAIASWLSNREIEKSLKRARRSEATLKEERDNLEVIVEERTQELKQAQAEKILQLSHMAELGQLSSGLIHDLATPLTTVSLNLEKLKSKEHSRLLEQTREGIKRIENFMESARLQIKGQSQLSVFSVGEETQRTIHALQHKAFMAGVRVTFNRPSEDLKLYGDPIKFYQIVTNLVANAIDAYTNMEVVPAGHPVTVEVIKNKTAVVLTVSDRGIGIKPADQKKIFEPFFTTKGIEDGTGIGLAIVKNNVENDFLGRIAINSVVGKGTKFRVTFPTRRQ